ncbi:MAG TPA: hypothetical protein VGJ13_10535 [Pseudonocardiaceae bacterium]|jgi:hypothetical protein
MLVDDARKIAAAIEERFNAGAETSPAVTAKVKSEELSPKSIPAGAGRPVFRRYFISIADSTRIAVLDLNQAGGLLDEVGEDWDPDRLFEAIRARDVPVEDAPAPESS